MNYQHFSSIHEDVDVALNQLHGELGEAEAMIVLCFPDVRCSFPRKKTLSIAGWW